jgi:hypothetical protein
MLSGVCTNDGANICNLGYACPFNFDQDVEERLTTGL